MRAARIAVQIRPIGVRGIDTAGSPPGNGLAASGEQAADTIGERVYWISGEKLLIALQRIALDRCSVGVLHTEAAEGFRSHGIDPVRREGWRPARPGPA